MSYQGSRINRLKTLPTLLASLVMLGALLASVSFASGQASDFSINATPITLCVNPGIDAQSSVGISSLGGFSGTVNLNYTISPSYTGGPAVSGVPSSVSVGSGQTSSFTVAISTTAETPIFVYTISILGLSGSFHQTNIQLAVSGSCSVGGSVEPTMLGSIGSMLLVSATIAGLVAAIAAGLVVYGKRNAIRARL